MMLHARARGGFTLIELLIVVAIIAIVMAASMSLITAPLSEKRRAVAEEALETGAGTLFERLVLDAHAATAMDATTSGSVVFTMDNPARTVSYSINSSGTLVRRNSHDNREAHLISQAIAWGAAEDSTAPGLWVVRLEATLPGYRMNSETVVKHLTVRVGREQAL